MDNRTSHVSRSFSAQVVRYLRQTKTLEEIGELMGLKRSFISLVGQGKRSFTIEHLLALERRMKQPLPLLILEALEKSVPKEVKSQYRTMHELLEKSGKLHILMAKHGRDKKK